MARVLSAFGLLVRSLHDVGFRHADLQPNNVLVEEPLPLGANLGQGLVAKKTAPEGAGF